ncbi:AraC family transcriptional regulator [Tenacibaculum amylolyticum]|uniref:AraC family transcriptional regulator n=1 Tax=Tenacibaculum amylolyticum TaxID=104269 RepID=UPI003892D6A1
MTTFENIKNYYNPIQPTIKAENEKIQYHEIQPNENLQHFIYCFWQLKTCKQLNKPFTYRVVSDGCIDIFFNQNQPSENFIMGFCRKYTEFPIGKSFNYIGIRFLPTAFPLLFDVNAKTLSNQSQELKEILPDLSNWITEGINTIHSFEKIAHLLEGKLTAVLINQELKFDHRFFNALNLIFQKRGFLDTEKELNTEVSSRQLRRIFNFYIGTTAKTFSNVVRFQHILNLKPSKQSLKENKIYFDVGFFDQAHFIKSFKTFYGITPSEAFH